MSAPTPNEQARDSCLIAIACVRAAYAAVKADINDNHAADDLAILTTPDSGDVARSMADRTKAAAADPTMFTPWSIDRDDPSGDPPNKSDHDADRAISAVAFDHYRYSSYGEDDPLRAAHESEAPAYRAQEIRKALEDRRGLVFSDPVDGSKQYDAMGQPGGYGPAVMTVSPRRETAIAVATGTGIAWATNGFEVSRLDLNEDPRTETIRTNDGRPWGKVIRARRHGAVPWVLSSYKLDRMILSARIIDFAQRSAAIPDVLRPQLIVPLGGNPGILSSLLESNPGSVAAWQPTSWAWDQFVFCIRAALGFPVANARDGARLGYADLTKRFLDDLAIGRKSEGLVTGKTDGDVDAILTALHGSGVLDHEDGLALPWDSRTVHLTRETSVMQHIDPDGTPRPS